MPRARLPASLARPDFLDLLERRVALLVRVVEVRRDPDPRLRPVVDQELALDQFLASGVGSLEVDGDRAAPALGVHGRVDGEAELARLLDHARDLALRLLADLVDADLANDLVARARRIER